MLFILIIALLGFCIFVFSQNVNYSGMLHLVFTPCCVLLLRADVLYLPEEVDWVKFNVDMSGYYMVHYVGEGWNSIIKVLQHNHTALSSNDRASLIHNIFQLVRSVSRPKEQSTELVVEREREMLSQVTF